MDRIAIARAERRRQATDELEAERGRATAVREEIERIVVELEGPGIDEEVFARMAPEDVALIRNALQGGPAIEIEGLDEEWLELEDEEAGRDEEQEAEIVRLQEELTKSSRRQEALERYLATLDGGPAESTIDRA